MKFLVTSSTIKAVLIVLVIFFNIRTIVLAQGAQLHPEPWGHVTLKQLNWGLIPTTVAPTIQEEQVFTLVASNLPDITISPVKYVDSPEDSSWSNCGVYFLQQGGKQIFITLFGSQDTGHCQETKAIGLMTEPGPKRFRGRCFGLCRQNCSTIGAWHRSANL